MTLLFKILAVILTFIAGFFPVMFQGKFFKVHDGRTNSHKRAVWGWIAAIALIAIVNVPIICNDKKISDDNDRKTKTILEYAQTNMALSAQLVAQSEELTQLANAECCGPN